MASPNKKVLRSQDNVRKYAYSDAFTPSDMKENAIQQPTQVPPKAPRSAFMCFTDAKKKEIMDRHGLTQETEDVLKIVAREWRALSDRERAHWDEEARNDKVRFVQEKAEYKGPWAIPKRRAKKHPLAPKRPMSAFLKYSQKRRALVKSENPDMSNTDVSRLLGEMWRNASPKERAPYIDQEEHERAIYKEEIKKWRDDQARLDAASRTTHKAIKDHYQPQPLYETSSITSINNSFTENAEEVGNQHDERMMFHSFGSYAAYRPHFRHASVAPLEAPPIQHSPQHAQHQPDYHDSDPLPIPHRSLHQTHLDDHAADAYANYPPRSKYFSDGYNFGFYNRYK